MNKPCITDLQGKTLQFLDDIISGHPLKTNNDEGVVASFDQRLKVALAVMKMTNANPTAESNEGDIDIKKLTDRLAAAGMPLK
jgi:hypothetical protein